MYFTASSAISGADDKETNDASNDKAHDAVEIQLGHFSSTGLYGSVYRRRHLKVKHGIVGEAADRILGVKRSSRGGGSVDLSRRARMSWIKIWMKRGRMNKAEALARELEVN